MAIGSETEEAPSPALRRPAPEDALRLAREQFLAGERVEMGALAEQLGINRTTLYRWVGEREQLLGSLFSGLVDEWLELARPQVKGTGVGGFLELERRILELGAAFEPLTRFAQREPALALRIITDREGQVTAKTNATVARMLEEMLPDRDVPANVVRAIALVASTLVWANIATSQEPDIDAVVDLSRTLLLSA